MYIRSSPRGPNRDPNQTLSNELLLYKRVRRFRFSFNFNFKNFKYTFSISTLYLF